MIAACHDHGIRIIPYITFTDLEHDTPAFPDHGQEWQIEPVAEFHHQTNLMCYGAEGWREHWKHEVDTILERFDFDGLYIDFWVGKMACRNLLHGCGHKYPRFTLPGLREMAWHAFRGVKAKGAGQFILSNTNLFAGALINNLVDIRLPGEWANIEETPEELVRGHLNSRRLGCNALLLRRPEVSLRSVSFSLRCQSPMVLTHGRSAEAMPELLMRYAELLRFFGIGGAETQSAFKQDGNLEWSASDGTVYCSQGHRGTLVVLANLNRARTQGTLRIAKPTAIGISPRKPYLVYRPDRGQLAGDAPILGRELRSFDLSLRPYEPALFFLAPCLGRPQVLWATHSDGIEERAVRRPWRWPLVHCQGRSRQSFRGDGVRGRSQSRRLFAGQCGGSPSAPREACYHGGGVQRASTCGLRTGSPGAPLARGRGQGAGAPAWDNARSVPSQSSAPCLCRQRGRYLLLRTARGLIISVTCSGGGGIRTREGPFSPYAISSRAP